MLVFLYVIGPQCLKHAIMAQCLKWWLPLLGTCPLKDIQGKTGDKLRFGVSLHAVCRPVIRRGIKSNVCSSFSVCFVGIVFKLYAFQSGVNECLGAGGKVHAQAR